MADQRDIDGAWHLVRKHQTAILQQIDAIPESLKRLRRFDRRALMDLYVPGLDLQLLAQHFGVSRSAIGHALWKMKVAASRLERAEQQRREQEEARCVVVPVKDEAEGEYVLHVLRQHEYTDAYITTWDDDEEEEGD